MECNYIVVMYSLPEDNLKDISIQITGQKGTSRPQHLQKPVTVIRSPNLGLLWQVELKLHQSFPGEGWFCDNFYIITPEGDSIPFPCQKYLDYRNPTVDLVINQEHRKESLMSSPQQRGEIRAVEYTVQVLGSPAGFYKDISIQLLGLKHASRPKRLEYPFTIVKSQDLKKIKGLILTLESSSVVGETWFCDNVIVFTPEGDELPFDCQCYLDLRNPNVVLYAQQEPQISIDSYPKKISVVPQSATSYTVERATQQTGIQEVYTVSAEISSVHSADHINIELIGTDGVSSPQPLSSSPIKVTCPPLGKFFLVKLTLNIHWYDIHVLLEWYCYKVTVTTPKGEIRNFSCYRYLDRKNLEVTLTDDNAYIDVPRTHQEIPSLLITQRKEELEGRQKGFGWKMYAEKLPKIIDADSVLDLPKELWFSLKKDTEMIFTAFKTFAKLKYETLFHWKKNWKNLDELKELLPKDRTEITDYVVENWKKDEFFGFQLLNGLNPMMIRRCTKLPKDSSFTDEMMKKIFGCAGLSKEIENGIIFICDYKRQRNLKANVIDDEQQYLNSPIVLLRLEDDKLMPFAIQVTQDKGKTHTVVSKDDKDQWKWTLAKTVVRAAEFAEHELNFHLLRTHLLGEVFTVATYRNLPSSHPLFKLLLPHTRYTLFINILAREKLISENGVFKSYTAIGEKSSMIKFLQEAMKAITYRSLCLPDDIKDRGMENIPHFYYRDDGTCLWDIILTFVKDVLNVFYKSNDDVKDDKDLQNWIYDIFVNGFNSSTDSGIPRSLRSLEELYKFVTMIIFTVSGQHGAVNNGQFDYGFWLPNFPSTLRADPFASITEETEISEKTLLDMLPNVKTTLHGLAVLKTLSTKSSDNRILGNYKEELFGAKDIKDKIKEFQEGLTVLTEGIFIRNKFACKPGYTFLSPANVSNSVDL